MKFVNEHHRKLREKISEKENKKEIKCFFMSFVDPDLPKGQRSLGVCIVDAPSFADAVKKTWELGINPNGEIQSYIVPIDNYKPEHKNRLMKVDLLIKYGLIEVH